MWKIKKNKTVINSRHKPIIKKKFFSWESRENLAVEFWYDFYILKKWLAWKATTIYVDEKWIRWRRCSICRVYREEENNFPGHWWKYKAALCNYCDKIKKKNQYTILKNTWEERKKLRTSRETWFKNKWKYNCRRKILKIIWYLDMNWKIIKKN